MGIASQLRNMGIPDDLIANATVDGKPVPVVDEPKVATERMNKTEGLYAIELDWQKREGLVATWKFEAVKFRLAKATFYTPDFLVVFGTGQICFDEVKGYERDDAVVKFKLAAELFPFWRFRMVKRIKRHWVFTRDLNNQPKGA